MIQKILFAFLALCLPLSLNGDDELILHVRAKKSLSSLYLGQPKILSSSFSSQYIENLYEIFRHDFQVNGYSDVKKKDSAVEKVLHEKPHELCQNLPARHTLFVELEGKKWRTTLYTPKITLGVKLKEVYLTGHLQSDINQLHQLADAIHYELYHVPGIASKKIVYAIQDPQDPNVSEIWMKHFDLADGEQLTYENCTCINPIWVPKSKSFIYTCYKYGQPKLYISTTEQTKGSLLMNFRGNQLLPSISSIGNMVAFVSNAGGRTDLFVQQLDKNHTPIGVPQQAYAHKNALQSASTFSPDGTKVAFVSDQSGTTRVYLLDLNELLKTHKRPKIEAISTKNRGNTSPSWSPNGKKIAYSATTDGIRQIWVYDLETQEELQLTRGMEHKENPRWAANSLHIIYNTTTPTYDLFVLNLNDPSPVQITQGAGMKHFPYWEQ